MLAGCNATHDPPAQDTSNIGVINEQDAGMKAEDVGGAEDAENVLDERYIVRGDDVITLRLVRVPGIDIGECAPILTVTEGEKIIGTKQVLCDATEWIDVRFCTLPGPEDLNARYIIIACGDRNNENPDIVEVYRVSYTKYGTGYHSIRWEDIELNCHIPKDMFAPLFIEGIHDLGSAFRNNKCPNAMFLKDISLYAPNSPSDIWVALEGPYAMREASSASSVQVKRGDGEWLYKVIAFDDSGNVCAEAEAWLASPDYGRSWEPVEWSVSPSEKILSKEDTVRMALSSHALHISSGTGHVSEADAADAIILITIGVDLSGDVENHSRNYLLHMNIVTGVSFDSYVSMGKTLCLIGNDTDGWNGMLPHLYRTNTGSSMRPLYGYDCYGLTYDELYAIKDYDGDGLDELLIKTYSTIELVTYIEWVEAGERSYYSIECSERVASDRAHKEDAEELLGLISEEEYQAILAGG